MDKSSLRGSSIKTLSKTWKVICLLLLATALLVFLNSFIALENMSLFQLEREHLEFPSKEQLQLKKQQQQKQQQHSHYTKKDWHNYVAMEADLKRVGVGEQGERASIKDETMHKLQDRLTLDNGYNALLSDSISVNRSLPDIRTKGCAFQSYLSVLPTVSIVITFYNEHFSVLVRSLHSIVNRSTPELIKEIILVDDHSNREPLFKQLEQYVVENFPKVKIIRLERRNGLIAARLAGAREATAEVLVFMASDVEANYNWLPPLLEPIALNKRTVVCPLMDIIDFNNFEYREKDEGAQGVFDWNFVYNRIPLPVEDAKNTTKAYKTPVMAGIIFAITKDLFWELGGYDTELEMWGGEQYELSFKIWMCGGELLETPCSRIGHIYKGSKISTSDPSNAQHLHRNYKRVAEVWMDEYKKYLYKNSHGIYEHIHTGDLTAQKSLREKLQCKSFKWYMKNVAYDLVKAYPIFKPKMYASGAIQSVAAPKLCIDAVDEPLHSEIGLAHCSKNLKHPQASQYWVLSAHRDLRFKSKDTCLDVSEVGPDARVGLWPCHMQQGNQFWYYDRKNQWLIHGIYADRCLFAKPREKQLRVSPCQKDNKFMKWIFNSVDDSALDIFFHGVPTLKSKRAKVKKAKNKKAKEE